MQEQQLNRIIQKRIFWTFAGVTLFFLVLLLLLLPYRLYTRDVYEARQNAREVSKLIRSGLLSTMISTGESNNIRGLIREFQKKYQFQFRMIRSSHVEKQHGVREDEQATDELIRQVLATGKSRDDWTDRTHFRFVAPFISDHRCQECHESVDGSKIAAGEVLGASEIIFDLSGHEADAVRLVLEMFVLLFVSLALMGLVFFFLVKRGILDRMVLIDMEKK